jgi:hypothetical protein
VPKPQGASYDDKGQRVCDNQSCNKCLTKERYALVVDKQKWSDTRAIDHGKSKGLAVWMHCESCDSRMSSDKKSVVYPDGYMPVREQDRSKATPEMRERMSGGGGGFKKGGGGSRHAKANAAAAAASADPELRCPDFCKRLRIDDAGEWSSKYVEWIKVCDELGTLVAPRPAVA